MSSRPESTVRIILGIQNIEIIDSDYEVYRLGHGRAKIAAGRLERHKIKAGMVFGRSDNEHTTSLQQSPQQQPRPNLSININSDSTEFNCKVFTAFGKASDAKARVAAHSNLGLSSSS